MCERKRAIVCIGEAIEASGSLMAPFQDDICHV
jgi:hypothetical protein